MQNQESPNIQQLQDLLQELHIVKREHETLKEEVALLRTKLEHQNFTPVQATVVANNDVSADRIPLTRTDIEIGYRVIIRNPRANQNASGTIVGFTPTRLIRIRTDNNQIVRRILSNLEIIHNCN